MIEVYRYDEQRPLLFSPEGIKALLLVKATTDRMLGVSGAFIESKALAANKSFVSLACVDYLCEIGELRELKGETTIFLLDRIFVKGDPEE